MKQLLQNLKTGVLELVELPVPELKRGHVLIRSVHSLVSIGTEKMLLGFGRSNWIEKIRSQPDKVNQVIQKAKTDGVLKTIEAVQNKLDTPIPLGYSSVGVVIGVGEGVSGFSIGDRVVSNGPHAEVVMVPQLLGAKIPDSVSDEAAVFTVTSAIALQGVRLLAPQLGETVAVIGLGLLGLITVQLLRAAGCRVIGVDFDSKKLDMAASFGAIPVALAQGVDPVFTALQLTAGHGVDGVLICASTPSSDPMRTAAQMTRKRGKVVLVGVIGNEWSRDDFYKKELQFQVSCSYGPGRYDTAYEERGQDYPYPFVRWTEQRNLAAVLALMADHKLDFSQFVDERVPFGEAIAVYDRILNDSSLVGVVFEYPRESAVILAPSVPLRVSSTPVTQLGIGFIGAGNYTKSVLLPALSRVAKGRSVSLVGIASQSGVSAHHLGKKYGFLTQYAHVADLLADERISVVFVTTRHDTHAGFVCEAIRAGKHVFVEKPLCLTLAELAQIESCMAAHPESQVMVGFNRRFSPHTCKLKANLGPGPMSMTLVMNAGAIPADHWTQGAIGGGRLVGEAVHYIDLAMFLADSEIVASQVTGMGGSENSDVVTINLQFASGSMASIHYFANGHASYPKEKITVFSAGKVLELDNFRQTRGFGTSRLSTFKTWGQDKGQEVMLGAWLDGLTSGAGSPIPVAELMAVSRVAIGASASLD